MPEAAGPVWLESFKSFTAIHLITVLVLGAAMVGGCWLGRCWRGSEREKRLRFGWGGFVAGIALVTNLYYALPKHWDITESLPLQLCDLAIIIAAIAMLTDSRVFRTMLYFWGIGLSTQAFITPTVGYGVGHERFWLFWIGHTCIVGSAVYDIVVGGYRPRLKDLGIISAISIGYLFTMLGINEWLSDADTIVNYGYVGRRRPSNPTLIDKLGPWPERVVIITLIVLVDYVVLWAIWPLARRIGGGEAGRDPVAEATSP